MLWVHWRSGAARLRNVRRENPWMLVLFGLFIVCYLLAGFFLFYKGLVFVRGYAVVGTLLTQRILFLIFAFFFLMLIFSNLIIGYASLFRSRETTSFFPLPLSPQNLFRWKFLESLAVSSWALLFLSAPMMAAYGMAARAAPDFYLRTALVFVPFVILPAALGAWLMFALLHALTFRWVKILLIAGVAIGLIAAITALRPVTEEEATTFEQVASFDQLLKHSRIGLNPWFPSSWMSKAVLYWSQGLTSTGGFYALLLTANALLAISLVFHPTGGLLRFTHARVATNRSRAIQLKNERRRQNARRISWFARLIDCLPFSRQSRALLLKDSRLFLRDPSQWSQFSIFMGLLVIYVVNLKNVAFTTENAFWIAMISYLNLTACSLTLSTLTTRFVFPQFSLEGRRLWILGLVPFGLDRMILQKFLGNAVLTSFVTTLLMLGSGGVLQISWTANLTFCAIIIVMSFTLSAVATGLGVLFPNLKEDNPSKIVTSFGGTLCLVLSFIYIVLGVAVVATPALLRFSLSEEETLWPGTVPLSIFGFLVISLGFALSTLIPGVLKAKRLEI